MTQIDAVTPIRPALQRLGLTLVPNMKHTDMIHKAEAFRAIVPAISRQP